jgi:hypothetical protein
MDMIKCVLCGDDYNIKYISKHLKKVHNITAKNYYDKYIDNSTHKCHISECKHETKFISISKGYSKFCSIECFKKDNPMKRQEVKEKLSVNLKEKFNDQNYRADISSKRKKTKLERYGDENYNNRDKVKNTCITKYGVEYYSQSLEFAEKVKQTSIEKYGVEHHLMSSDIKNKRKNTVMNRYGVDHVSKLPEVKKKILDSRRQNPDLITNLKLGIKKAWENKHDEIIQNRVKSNNKSFGCDWPMQSEEIRKKAFNRYKSTIYFRILSELSKLDIEYIDSFDQFDIYEKLNYKCKKHNLIYKNSWYNISLGFGRCPICQNQNKKFSRGEEEVYDFIKSMGLDAIRSANVIYNPKTKKSLQIDVYIDKQKIGIEFDGLYWHNDDFRNNDYHLMKTRLASDCGIRLIHIFEDEWYSKGEIVKETLKYILNCAQPKRIHARQCVIKPIDSREKNVFLNKFHLLGKDLSIVKLGAFYEDELVSVMTFGHGNISRGNKTDNLNIWELTRFAINYKYHIPGIFGKFINNFKKTYVWDKIFTYADLRWFTGRIYELNGFEKISFIDPDYWYLDNTNLKRIHRFTLRKKRNDPPTLTEWELRRSQGYKRIWDCGKIKFELKNEEGI